MYQVKISSKLKKSNKLRWLASDMNFKLLHTRCPIAHVPLCQLMTIVITKFFMGKQLSALILDSLSKSANVSVELIV